MIRKAAMIRKALQLCCTIVFIAGVSITAVADTEVHVVQSRHKLCMENKVLRFEYDLSRGTYRAVDRRDDSVCITDGVFQMNDLASTLPGLTHSWKSRAVSDALGKGKAITISISQPGQAVLRFEVTVYKSRSCIVFTGGYENLARSPVQVKRIMPLAEGVLFGGFDMSRNFRLVDGNGGGEPLEWGVKKYTPVYKGTYVHSRNNVLVTFGENESRRSLVMGGLTYHDFEKFAGIAQPRKLELSKQQNGDNSLVCYLNLPEEKSADASTGESLRLVEGDGSRKFSYQALWGEEFATAASGSDGVVLEASGMDKGEAYVFGFSWWHTDRDDRVQSVAVDSGAGTEKQVLLEKQTLPMWHRRKKEDPRQVELRVPSDVYRSGAMRILFTGEGGRSEALVNEVWLRRRVEPLLPRKLTAVNSTPRPRHKLSGSLYAEDPVGKRVDPGVRYMPDDRFYIDFVTDNPFENLQQYGRAVRAAQRIELNMYDFPTVCLWYANHRGYGGGMATNDTVGAVREIEVIRNAGFLNYSRAAVRLVPDCYSKNNQQGWWDDEHFRKYGSTNLEDFKGGTYKVPYETSEKWGKAVTERGGIPLTYCQTGFRSEDYAFAFPGHMLFNNPTAWKHESYKRPLDDDKFWGNAWVKSFRVWSYDYTDPGFIRHIRDVYAAYRSGGIKGLMFDYPARGWASGGGMEDVYATTAGAYRDIFRFANEGLGPECYVHERNMERGSDISLGLVASQRTENDTDRISPQVITRCGLRWYKNRVVVNYDTDSKNIYRLRDDRDAVRSLLTMSYVTTGRLLLANSFSQLSPQIIHDLTRIFPFHTTPKTARPVDAFTKTYPSVYDFEVSPKWHQVTFYNSNDKESEKVEVAMSGDTAEGALGLSADKEYYVYDFWNDAFRGKVAGRKRLSQTLRAGEVRMMSVHEVSVNPQVISTNRHIMQGYIDLIQTRWLVGRNILKGVSRITGGDPYVVTIAGNGYRLNGADVNDRSAAVGIVNLGNGLSKMTIIRNANAIVEWSVRFKRPKKTL